MYALNLYQRANQNTAGLAYQGDLTYHAQGWRRSSRSVGGFWAGSFSLTSDTMSEAELEDFYDQMLGCRLVETCYGMTSWEGYIETLDYRNGGATFQRTLEKDVWHNSVDVWFRNEDGDTEKAGVATNDDSIARYGTSELIATIGNSYTTTAEHMRNTQLNAYAWPRSREVGTHSFGSDSHDKASSVFATVAGYWHTLNWTYYLDELADTPNAIIAELLTDHEFITEGYIEDNSAFTLWPADGTRPVERGQALEFVISFGDPTGDVWQGGVYQDRRLDYREAPTVWDYQYRGGQLLDKAGYPTPFPLLRPGFMLYNASAPSGGQPAGDSSAWDDPRYRHVSEVEFLAPNSLALRFSGMDTAVVIERRAT